MQRGAGLDQELKNESSRSLWRLLRIQRTAHAPAASIKHVRIYHGGAHILVAE